MVDRSNKKKKKKKKKWKLIRKTRLFKISPPKMETFQIKKLIRIPAQNIDYGYSLERPRRGCSNECPQSMFL